jgi:hypothetical protein
MSSIFGLPLWCAILLALLFVGLVTLLLIVICCPGERFKHWQCWSHPIGTEDEEDARVKHFPHAEPLKASLLARQQSSDPSQPLLSQGQRQSYTHPLGKLLQPVLPGSNPGSAILDPARSPTADLTPSSISSSDSPSSPYSPGHSHPYATATFQAPTWGSRGAAAILKPAMDLQTPETQTRSLQIHPAKRLTPETGFRSIARDVREMRSAEAKV